MRKRTQAREYVLQVLYQAEMREDKLDNICEAFWEFCEVKDPEIKKFSEKLICGTLAHCKAIDKVISKHAQNWALKRMASIDRNILRFATYELLYCDDIPPKVTINEAVNIAKKFSQQDSGKFVNGVLDKINHSEKANVG